MIPDDALGEAKRLRKLYAEAEEKMIAYMRNQLKQGSPNDYGWGQKKLSEVQRINAELERQVKALTKKAKGETDALIEDAYDMGADAFGREYSKALGGTPRKIIPDARKNAIAQLIRETDEKFSAQSGWILRDAQDAYRSIIGEVVSLQATGVTTTIESIQTALNKFADKGISSFVDSAGRTWGMDTYSEMAIRTGMMNAAVGGYTDDALANGERLVIVSDHADECPLCAVWERKVLALVPEAVNDPGCDGKTLSDAVGAGLFHPNCRHAVTAYIHGLTDRSAGKERIARTAEMDARGYAASQKQRAYERNVRKWKRRQAAALTPEAERLAQAYVDRWENAIITLTDETGLRRDYWREGAKVKLSDAAAKLPRVELEPIKVVKK